MSIQIRIVCAIGIVVVIVVIGALAQIIILKKNRTPSQTGGLESNNSQSESVVKPSATADSEKPRRLSLNTRTVTAALYTTEQAPVDVVFRNDTKYTVRVLDAFSDPVERRLFFSVTLKDVNGVPIFTNGGGKIDFTEKSLKYIELAKGEEYVVNINLKDYIPSSVSLEQGVYFVSVVYRNQYGDNCFKGTLESAPLALSLIRVQPGK